MPDRLRKIEKTTIAAAVFLSAVIGSQSMSFGAEAQNGPLKGGVSKSDLGVDLDARYGVSTKKADKPFKAIVENIRPGSMAFYSGLRSGDRIISVAGGTEQVTLTFDRAGKTYSVSLAPIKGQRVTPPRPGARQQPLSQLMTPDQQRELIGQHDVVLIIDRTGSMETVDCPGERSRWNWCRDQSVNFMQDMSAYLRDLSIITFNDSYERFDHVPVSKIPEVFARTQPTGGTNAAAPLHSVLTDYFRKRAADANTRPVMIAMITDGLPNLPAGPEVAKMELQKEILSAVGQMKNSAEVTITFLQVGNDYQGGQFLTNLSERLGVPYDIVDTKTFNEMKRIGLREALVDALGGRTSTRVEAKVAPSAPQVMPK